MRRGLVVEAIIPICRAGRLSLSLFVRVWSDPMLACAEGEPSTVRAINCGAPRLAGLRATDRLMDVK